MGMEFWILLALIVAVGIFVIVSRNNSAQQLGKLQSELNRQNELDAKLNAIEKRLDAFNSDMSRLNSKIDSAMRNSVSDADLENLHRRVQSEMPPPIDTSAIAEHINKIAEALNNTRDELSKLQSEVDALKSEQKTPDLQPLLNTLQQHQNVINRLINGFNALQARLNDQRGKIDELQSKVAGLKQTPPPPLPPPLPKPSKELTIADFNIKPTDEVFITNEPKQAAEQLKIANDLSGIEKFLDASDYDKQKREQFLGIISNYKRNLKKVIDKVNRGKFDEDIFSQDCTDAFFGTLSNFFIKTMMTAIYRGRNENPEFYAGLLEKINEYLAACRVYTLDIAPKTFMKSADLECMEIIKRDIDDKSKDKFIDEVERLPYNVNYVNEDGELSRFCCEGRMFIFKFAGDKK